MIFLVIGALVIFLITLLGEICWPDRKCKRCGERVWLKYGSVWRCMCCGYRHYPDYEERDE
jgi:hypothetical protein